MSRYWDDDFIAHSSGPWKKHKYIKKIGEGANAIYQYAKSSVERAGADYNYNRASHDMTNAYDRMLDSETIGDLDRNMRSFSESATRYDEAKSRRNSANANYDRARSDFINSDVYKTGKSLGKKARKAGKSLGKKARKAEKSLRKQARRARQIISDLANGSSKRKKKTSSKSQSGHTVRTGLNTFTYKED